MLNQKDIARLRSLEGKIRGESIKINFDCYLAMEGRSGLEKLKQKMAELDFFLDYKNIDSSGWYAFGDDVALTALAAEVFNWDAQKLKEFGRNIHKISFIEKMFIQYIASSEKLIKSGADHWQRHINVGKLEVAEYNKQEKYLIICLKDFKAHWTYCAVLMGFFENIISLSFAASQVFSRENKCVEKGDSFHEYFFQWQ